MNAAAARAVANHRLKTDFSSMIHAGDPVLDGVVWRVPIHVDFPVPGSSEVLPFRNLGEIMIDDGSGLVTNMPTLKERESRMAEELGRVLAGIQNDIPGFECRRCGRCCGPLGATVVEMDILDNHVAENNIVVPEFVQTTLPNNGIMRTALDGVQCPYLGDGECLVYFARPTICRLFGTGPGLIRCPFGGRAKSTISHETAKSILRRVDVLSRLWVAIKKRRQEVGD